MRALPLALALAILAAGCLATPAGEVEPAALLPLPDGVVGRAGVLHAGVGLEPSLGGAFSIGVRATEPTIGATPDGALFMTGFGAIGPKVIPTVLRSLDKGQTWDDVGPGTHPNTNDPYVYVDPDTGRVFMNDIVPLSCTFLSWSDDLGETWTTNPYSCGNTQVNDHQTIVTAKPRTLTTVGYPKIVYICVNNVAYFACATSRTGGLTFSPQVPVDVGLDPAYSFALCGATTGHLRAGPDGKVYLPKSDCSVQDSVPVVYVTEDDGLTWTKKTISTQLMSGHELGFAVDEVNNLYASWEGPDGRQYFAASTDGGDTWSEPLDVTAPGVSATMFTALAAAGEGKVALAYVGSTIEGGYEGKETGNPGLAGDLLGQPELPEWDNATWNGYLAIIVGAHTATPTLVTSTVNDPADPFARGLCGRTRCHGMNDFIDVIIDAEGRPWAAFVDVCTEECVSDASMDADRARGVAGTLLQGPSLRTGAASLLPIAPPP